MTTSDLLSFPLYPRPDVRENIHRNVFGSRPRPLMKSGHPFGTLAFEPNDDVLCMVCTSGGNWPTAREVLEATVRIAHLQGARVWVQFFDTRCHGNIVDSTSALALEHFIGGGGTNVNQALGETIQRLPLPNGRQPDHVVLAFNGYALPLIPPVVNGRTIPTTLLLPPSLGHALNTSEWCAAGVAAPRIAQGWIDQIESEVQAILRDNEAALPPLSSEASTFMNACRTGDLATIEACWKPDVAQTVEYGQSALMLAVLHGHVNVVDRLLPYSDLRHQDHQGKTALMHAAMLLDPVIVHRLLPFSDSLQQDHQGRNALMWGLRHDNLPQDQHDPCWNTVQALVLRADPQQIDHQGNSALMWAQRLNHPSSLIERLIPGSDLNQQNEHGNTPLMLALNSDAVRQKPFNHPVWDMVRTMIPGSDLTLTNKEQETPLLLALQACMDDLVISLLDRSDPTQQGSYGQTPLMLAVRQQPVNLTLVQALLPKSDVHQRDHHGRTALDLAVERENYTAVSLLESFVLRDVARPTLDPSIPRPRL